MSKDNQSFQPDSVAVNVLKDCTRIEQPRQFFFFYHMRKVSWVSKETALLLTFKDLMDRD